MKNHAMILFFLLMMLFIAGCRGGRDRDSGGGLSDSSDHEIFLSSERTSGDSSSQSEKNQNPGVVSNKEKQQQKDKNSDGTASKPTQSEHITKVYSDRYCFKVSNPQKKTFYDPKNGNTFPFCLYVPQDYSVSKQYPVILFLHGAGEIGDDNYKHLNGIRNMFRVNGDLVSQAIIICPQTNEWWSLDREEEGDRKGTLGSVLHLLEKIQNEYSCDENRIYVTGLSMGGYATWELLEHYGDLFAAGIPLCGFSNAQSGEPFKNIPIRIYHGTSDSTVPFSQSQRMVDLIRSAGGKKAEIFSLNGYGHDVWNYAYGNRDLFSWMFAQNKAKNPTMKYEVIPYFRIVDRNGKTVISDRDIDYTSFIVEGFLESSITAEIHLTQEGREKLNGAYATSGGREFTVYLSTERYFSFTARKPLSDDVFKISGVFQPDTYADVAELFNLIEKNKDD